MTRSLGPTTTRLGGRNWEPSGPFYSPPFPFPLPDARKPPAAETVDRGVRRVVRKVPRYDVLRTVAAPALSTGSAAVRTGSAAVRPAAVSPHALAPMFGSAFAPEPVSALEPAAERLLEVLPFSEPPSPFHGPLLHHSGLQHRCGGEGVRGR
jgi:hypothetical protein